MKEQMITVIGKRVGEKPEVLEIENKYESLRDFVDGLITCVGILEGVDMIANDEGLLLGMPLNLTYMGMSIVGDVLFVAYDDEGENRSLTEEEIKILMGMFVEI